MKTIKLLALVLVSIITSCGGSGGGGSDDVDPPQPVEKTPPGSFSLVSPANNAVCVEDRSHTISNSSNATSYEWIFTGSSGSVIYATTTGANGLSVNIPETSLPDGIAYSWRVIAKNADGEKSSMTFSASTPGIAEINYVPTVNIDFSQEILMFNDAESEDIQIEIFESTTSDFEGVPALFTGTAPSGTQYTFDEINFTFEWIKIILIDESGNRSPEIIQSR